jgi:hypothetical protein
MTVSPVIKPGDVVRDLAQGALMQVVEERGTVASVREEEEFDLATYKSHPLFRVEDRDSVYSCVYLQDSLKSLPSKSYDYPESRLARVPVEEANDDLERVQDNYVRHTYTKVFAAVDEETAEDLADKLFENGLSRLTPGEEEVVSEALELAELERLERDVPEDAPSIDEITVDDEDELPDFEEVSD